MNSFAGPYRISTLCYFDKNYIIQTKDSKLVVLNKVAVIMSLETRH